MLNHNATVEDFSKLMLSNIASVMYV